MTTNYPSPTNISRIYQFFQWSNTVNNGWFGDILVITIFISFFIVFKRFPLKEAFATASFIGMLSAILLSLLGIVTPILVLLFIIMSAIGAASLYFGD
jgi:hypothetical protein